MGVAQAALDVLAHALVALARQRKPHVDGRVPVPGAHDGRVPAVQVLHIVGQSCHILHRGGRISVAVPLFIPALIRQQPQ